MNLELSKFIVFLKDHLFTIRAECPLESELIIDLSNDRLHIKCHSNGQKISLTQDFDNSLAFRIDHFALNEYEYVQNIISDMIMHYKKFATSH